ncbi:hypothetical protein PA598K_03409 [Paenibacillus sp. 598K]|uniref:hypothetical protein n=1 Tax=Paenibacillus sp. 598K TaxID=1117987 RepID=UPI000FF96B6E|nr:hypothetical protein [Paenibacillus sp. 598K]GBF75030.1 hypothetical protein PA598K_03409 [Paenibacillus sp. 598K]
MFWKWYKDGEHIVAGEPFYEMIRNDLYGAGVLNVPQVLLGEEEPYGQRVEKTISHLPLERFFHVSGSLRDGIRTSISFKTRLRELTWRELRAFNEASRVFERAVELGDLTPELLQASLDAHGRVLALTEFNAMLPLQWYRDRLAALCEGREPIQMDSFSYSEIMPHRLLLRRGKLKLALTYLRCGGKLRSADYRHYIKHYSHFDIQTLPMLKDPQDEERQALQEVEQILSHASEADVREELASLRTRRYAAKARYDASMGRVVEYMHQNGEAWPAIRNFASALAMISLATTEEEYRHICQDRFWRALGAVIRALELPPSRVNCSSLVEALRQRPLLSLSYNLY